MSDLKTRLTLDGSDFTRGMDDASKSVDDFTNSSKSSAAELLKQMKSMEGLGKSTSNYRRQLGQMTRQIQDLTINYRAMSNEMKNSDFGRSVAAEIQNLTQEASKMKDTIQDASNSVKLLASDTANLDAAKMGIQGLSSAFSLVASAGILGADSTEKMVKVMAKLKAIESATNAVITIANVLNKDSILMLKIKAMQTRLATKAQTEYTAATGAATVAQRIFNTVAKSNPYVLLATAILAVVGAMVLFTKETEEATEALDGYVSLADKTRKTQNDLAQAYGQTAGKLKASYIQLREQWNLLKTDMEKNKFIQDNADKFKEMGLAINGVNDAEQAFTEYNSVILKSFDLRAKAAAAAAVAAKRYQEALELRQQVKNEESRQPYKVGDVVPTDLPSSDRAYYGRRRTDKRGNEVGDYEFDETGLALYYADKKMEAFRLEQEGLDLYKQEAELQQELNDLIAENTILQQENNNVRGNGNGSGNNKETYDKGSVADYEAQIASLNKRLKEQKLTWEEIQEIQNQIVKLEADKFLAANGGMIPIKPKKLTQLELKDALPEKINPLYIPTEIDVDMKQFRKDISSTISGIQSISSSISSVYSNWKKVGESWSDSNPFEATLDTLNALLSTLQTVMSVIESINTLTELFDTLQATGWLIQKKKTEETAKQAIAEGVNVGLAEQEAVANTVSAAAKAGESAANVPMVGWVLAIGAVAAIVAALVAAKSGMNFAQGGIVPGRSFGGDHIAANLNSGEMVLNTQQQRNLFNLLNNGASSTTGGEVKFTIEGQQLVGVLSNYNKKMNKI